MAIDATTNLTLLEAGGVTNYVLANQIVGYLASCASRWIVISNALNNAPGAPTNGDAYVLSGAPTGGDDWDDIGATTDEIVFYFDGWRKGPALREGLQVYDQAASLERTYDGAAWV